MKGLSEREYPADTVIWPIQFSAASNELPDLYATIERNTGAIRGYLLQQGVQESEITLTPVSAQPSITARWIGAAPR